MTDDQEWFGRNVYFDDRSKNKDKVPKNIFSEYKNFNSLLYPKFSTGNGEGDFILAPGVSDPTER